MAGGQYYRDEPEGLNSRTRDSMDSVSSVSSTSIVLEEMNHQARGKLNIQTPLMTDEKYDNEGRNSREERGPSKTVKAVLWTMCGLCLAGWLLALFLFLKNGTMPTSMAPGTTDNPTDEDASSQKPYLGAKRAVKFNDVLEGKWYARSKKIKWINQEGKDGMIIEQGGEDGRDYLVIEDVRSRKDDEESDDGKTLIEDEFLDVDGRSVVPNMVWPSPDLKKVLVLSEKKRNWRYSFTGLYWIYDVEKQTTEPLDPEKPDARVQLATWAPTGKSIVFTRDNNMFIRNLDSQEVKQITTDGGRESFYGIPDWVYEEEVLQMNTATWISEDGDYVAFLRTNETMVPEFPVQYYISRPSGKAPEPGLEEYPEVRQIKYPKAGAPNPVVNVHFYDVKKAEMFNVTIENDFEDDSRIITEVLWAGKDGKVLVRETNRESDNLKVVLIDVVKRTGKTVREDDLKALDGGWFEISQSTKFIPADPANGRQHDGYIDIVIIDGYNHIAYFSPVDSPTPKVNLTHGKWEVVKAPSAVDLKKNIVYFVATKRSPTNRHVYSVNLDGTGMKAVTDDSKDAYYEVSFSTGCGYALLSYKGPDIPKQTIISTESLVGETFAHTIAENKGLADLKAKHDLPTKIYQTVNVDGFELQVVERRPANFDENKKYPVVFYLYNGPNSQSVDQRFSVDFQSYMASNLGFVVVTVDGRGTGYSGRKLKCAIRDNIGYYEARDQIESAKIWKAKKYIDSDKIGIWGWSYGGFTTLKTLETDGGETFKYGVAVAPVTDWRFYDSVYTNRYMHTPQNNEEGYDNATITDMESLSQNVRFLMMHGASDDNVHMQSSLTLLDSLNIAGVTNYDFHTFPDSDHSIYFHNANKMVYGRIANWFTNAFNGEWLKVANARPLGEDHSLRRRGLVAEVSL